MAFRDISFTATGKPIVKIAEIKNGISGQTKFTTAEYDKDYLISSGDMLFSWSGQPETSIDTFWYRGKDGWLNQHIFKVLPNADYCLPEFFYYLMKYLKPNFIGIARNKQTTGLGHVTKADLKNIEVGIPPLAEQRRIAGILGALDDKIELNRKMNRTLEEMAQALFKSWFIDFDGHTDFQDSPLGPIPKGWKVGCLGDDFDLTMGQSPPGDTYNENGDGLPFYQGATDFGERFPSRRIFCREPKRVAKAGDTLISVRAPVGRTNVATESCCLGRGVAALRHKSGSASYTYAVAKSLESHFEVFNAEGTIFGSINKNDFLKISIILPPSSFIENFDKIIFSTDKYIDTIWRESNALTTLRDSLLKKLFSFENNQ